MRWLRGIQWRTSRIWAEIWSNLDTRPIRRAAERRTRSRHFHHSSFHVSNISFTNPASISENILYITPASISATYFHHSSWGIHETLKIPSNINIIFCDELSATNCPRRIARDELSATNCPATNCPRRIVRDELSCDELSGHRLNHSLIKISVSQEFSPVWECLFPCRYPSFNFSVRFGISCNHIPYIHVAECVHINIYFFSPSVDFDSSFLSSAYLQYFSLFKKYFHSMFL